MSADGAPPGGPPNGARPGGATRPLVVVGDYAWDVLIRTNSGLLPGGDTFGEIALAPGGSAANTAVWAQRSGVPTTFVGKVGRDRLGGLAEDELSEEGLERRLVTSESQATGSVAVWIDHTGQRSMVSGKGADHHLLPSELPRDLLVAAEHLHLHGWSFFDDPPRAAAREAARVAKEAGATLSFDPGSFQMIGELGVRRFIDLTADLRVDLLFPNHEEGTVLTGEESPERIVPALKERYPGARIALKLDEHGAVVEGPDGRITPVPPADGVVMDATGAGDAFAGAFLARSLRGASDLEAASFATKVSAWVIEHVGARPKPDARLQEILTPQTRRIGDRLG